MACEKIWELEKSGIRAQGSHKINSSEHLEAAEVIELWAASNQSRIYYSLAFLLEFSIAFCLCFCSCFRYVGMCS